MGLFLERMRRLGGKCGPVIFQLEYTFYADRFETFAAFLKDLPPPFRHAVEVRYRSCLNR